VTRSREAVYDPVRDGLRSLGASHPGRHRGYGVATWHAFRVAEDDERYLSLAEVPRAGRGCRRGGRPRRRPRVRAIQLPFNVAMADAFTRRNQRSPGDDSEPVSTLELAHEAGLRGGDEREHRAGRPRRRGGSRPTSTQPSRARPRAARAQLRTERAGVTSSLVGTSDLDHVRENVAARTFDPLGASAFDAVFE